jgi:hypothetical protein
MRAGDVHAEFYERSPLIYWGLLSFKQHDINSQGDTISHTWMRSAETVTALEADYKLLGRSLNRYMHEPLLVFRKLLLAPVMFWTLSSTPFATVASSIMQIPLLALFVISAVRTARQHGLWSLHSAPILLAVSYFLSHVPVMSIARFGVVLIPTMLVYAVTAFQTRTGREQRIKPSS